MQLTPQNRFDTYMYLIDFSWNVKAIKWGVGAPSTVQCNKVWNFTISVFILIPSPNLKVNFWDVVSTWYLYTLYNTHDTGTWMMADRPQQIHFLPSPWRCSFQAFLWQSGSQCFLEFHSSTHIEGQASVWVFLWHSLAWLYWPWVVCCQKKPVMMSSSSPLTLTSQHPTHHLEKEY